jgi:hypothetical protein
MLNTLAAQWARPRRPGATSKIGRATRLMRLDAMRHPLYRESIGFLPGGDRAR